MPIDQVMRVPAREDMAWFAGIVCGEGTFSIHRPRRFVGVRLTVGQSSSDGNCPEMLTRLMEIFGAGRIYRMAWKKREHHKTIWQFYVHKFAHVQAIAAMLWPWLTPEKKAQVKESFATYHAERAVSKTRNYAV